MNQLHKVTVDNITTNNSSSGLKMYRFLRET